MILFVLSHRVQIVSNFVYKFREWWKVLKYKYLNTRFLCWQLNIDMWFKYNWYWLFYYKGHNYCYIFILLIEFHHYFELASDTFNQYLLEDHLFEQILYSTSPELEESRKILQNIIRRRLYKCLGQTQSEKMEEVSAVGDGVFTVVLNHLLVTGWSDTLTQQVKLQVLTLTFLFGIFLSRGCVTPGKQSWLRPDQSVVPPTTTWTRRTLWLTWASL